MPLISVIIPVHNGVRWIDECFESILFQKYEKSLSVEVSVYNDASTDDTILHLMNWSEKLQSVGMTFSYSENDNVSQVPNGVGYAKNKAVQQSRGDFLCFQDIDDIMLDGRLQKQYDACKDNQNCLVGSKFERIPEGSTDRYTKWANNLSDEKLTTQKFTSNGPTIIMPTWFCSRLVYNQVGGFDESGKGTPEDLIFFYNHLNNGGGIIRVNDLLLIYRYHPLATTFSVHKETIFNIRMKELESRVLCNWKSFTIWNAGKQGRKFYRSLSEKHRAKVSAFCDVDVNKIEKGVYIFEESDIVPKPRIPILHFSNASPPFIICMKLDLTDGQFESNLNSLNICEGTDYVLFT